MSDVKESSTRLRDAICPNGITYPPNWFTAIGVDTKSQILVVYASKPKVAHKALQKILSSDGKFDGFAVEVHKCGPMRLCKEKADE